MNRSPKTILLVLVAFLFLVAGTLGLYFFFRLHRAQTATLDQPTSPTTSPLAIQVTTTPTQVIYNLQGLVVTPPYRKGNVWFGDLTIDGDPDHTPFTFIIGTGGNPVNFGTQTAPDTTTYSKVPTEDVVTQLATGTHLNLRVILLAEPTGPNRDVELALNQQQVYLTQMLEVGTASITDEVFFQPYSIALIEP